MLTALRPRLFSLAVAALSLHAASSAALAQEAVPVEEEDSTIHELRRSDGSRIYGRVEAADGDQVTFVSLDGIRMEFDRRFVRLRPARGRVVDGEFWPEDNNATRLFFAPTGRTLEAGQGYGGMFLILPFVGYGATDDLTLAGGIPPVGEASGGSPVWLAPKLRIHASPEAQISTGAFAVYTPAYSGFCDEISCEESTGGAWDAIAYGVGTFGDADRALHAGAGVAFMNSEDEVWVPIMLGGEVRVSRRNKLVTENWVIPGKGGASMAGVRMIGQRWTTDLGWMFLVGDGDVPYFPIVSFSYAFGPGR